MEHTPCFDKKVEYRLEVKAVWPQSRISTVKSLLEIDVNLERQNKLLITLNPIMNPKMLIIDSSMPRLKLAISQGEETKGVYSSEEDHQHIKTITNAIENLLDKCQIGISELDAICIHEGPGSFTGLRIGSSTAKGMAIALNIPIIAIKGLEAYCLELSKLENYKDRALFMLLDARRNNYFFVHSMNGRIIHETAFMSEKEIMILVEKEAQPAIWRSENKEEVELDASMLIPASFKKWAKKDFIDIANFEPEYYLNNYQKNVV